MHTLLNWRLDLLFDRFITLMEERVDLMFSVPQALPEFLLLQLVIRGEVRASTRREDL